MTNFEKVKDTISLDEMANIMTGATTCCKICIYGQDDYCEDKQCIDGVKAWLEQEAQE